MIKTVAAACAALLVLAACGPRKDQPHVSPTRTPNVTQWLNSYINQLGDTAATPPPKPKIPGVP